MAAISGSPKPVDVKQTGAAAPPSQATPAAPPPEASAPQLPKDQAVQSPEGLKDAATKATTADEKTFEGWAAASQVARNNIQECAEYLKTGQVKAIPPQQATKELMTLFNHLTSENTVGMLPITQTGRNLQQMTEDKADLGRQAREHVGDFGYDSMARFWAGNIKDLAAEKEKQGMSPDAAIASAILENAQVKSSDDLTLKETCPELFMAAEKHHLSHTDAEHLLHESDELSVKAAMSNPQLQTWYETGAGICKYLRSQGQQIGAGQNPQLLDPQTAKNNFETLAAYWKDDRFSLFPPISIAGQELQNAAKGGDPGAISQAHFGGWDAPQRLAMRDWYSQAKAIKGDNTNPLSKLPTSMILAKTIADAPDDGQGNHFELKLSAIQYLTSAGVAASQAQHVDPNAAGIVA